MHRVTKQVVHYMGRVFVVLASGPVRKLYELKTSDRKITAQLVRIPEPEQSDMLRRMR